MRAVAGAHDLYWFSIEPFRLVELLWPNVMGVHFQGNTHWRDALKLPGVRPEIWVPWMYLGAMTLMLALGALALRQGPPWRVWLTALVVVSLLGSLGQCTSPIWMARVLASTSHWPFLRDLLDNVGPFDPDDIPNRLDGFFRDGDGSVYWWMTVVLPGFRQFRFPAKLFTFTALGLAALAGMGWDDLLARRAGRIVALFTFFLVIEPRRARRSLDRPARHPDRFSRGRHRLELRSVRCGRRIPGDRPQPGACLDRAGAGSGDRSQGPDTSPVGRLVRLAAGHGRPGGGQRPMRLDRPAKPYWTRNRKSCGSSRMKSASTRDRAPSASIACRPGIRGVGRRRPSADRAVDFVVWEHDTLLPKYGINLGVEYTHTFGVGQIYDYEWFFGSSPRIVRNLVMARALGVDLGKEIVYFPRRSFDIWNTRYFVIPFDARGWRDPLRGYASFLFEAERIYPRASNAARTRRRRGTQELGDQSGLPGPAQPERIPPCLGRPSGALARSTSRALGRRRRRRDSGDPLRRRPTLA